MPAKVTTENTEKLITFQDAIPDDDPARRKLTVTGHSTVQPVSLLRLGVFTPTSRSKNVIESKINASEELSFMEFARREGYTNVTITGPALNYYTDFRCWMGIIHSFSVVPDALIGNRIRLRFSEFASYCGYTSKRIDSRLREEISDSLTRIRSKSISFRRPGVTKFAVTGLLLKAEFDTDVDEIILEADQRLWELYQNDHLSLLRRKPLLMLPRHETAQAIYTFFEALPAPPAPITFKRLRERLMMPGEVKSQNRKITAALTTLKDIGYLEYHLSKSGVESVVHITKRNPTLKFQPK